MAFWHANNGWFHSSGGKGVFNASSPLTSIKVKVEDNVHSKELLKLIYDYFAAEYEAVKQADKSRVEDKTNEQKQDL